MKKIKIYNTLIVTIMSDEGYSWQEDAAAYADSIDDALEGDKVDLAEYADDCKKLKYVEITTEYYNGKLYGVATCDVEDDWNDDDTAQLKEYLTGQYADGWGEGFEQREIVSWIWQEECEGYDEDAEEYYADYYNVRYYVYVNFWQSKDFKIMTENELKK